MSNAYAIKVAADLKVMLEKAEKLKLKILTAKEEEQEALIKEWEAEKSNVQKKSFQLHQLREKLPAGSVPEGALAKMEVDVALETINSAFAPIFEKLQAKKAAIELAEKKAN